MKSLAGFGDSLRKASANLGDSLKQARDEAVRKASVTKELIVEQASVARGKLEQGWSPQVLDDVGDILPRDAEFIIEIIEARDVPKVDLFIDPYIEGYFSILENDVHKRISDIFKTPVKMDNDNPVWNFYANLQCTPPRDAYLTLCICNSERPDPVSTAHRLILSAQLVNNSRLLGTVRIPVRELSLDEEPRNLPFTFQKFGTAEKNPDFCVVLGRVFLNQEPPARKMIFLIRHGESLWNRAMAKKDVGALMALDHALTPHGIQQAQDLARQWRDAREALAAEDAADAADAGTRGAKKKPAAAAGAGLFSERQRRTEYLRGFLQARAVFTSPLTRAVQVVRARGSATPRAARALAGLHERGG
jgi:hypothetical protein